MNLHRGIRDNLRFLIAEVAAQIDQLYQWFDKPDAALRQRLQERSHYVHSLQARILDDSLQHLGSKHEQNGDHELLGLRAAETVARELSRVNDQCLECLRTRQATGSEEFAPTRQIRRSLNRVRWGIDLIPEALQENDTRTALKLGDVEQKLAKTYKKSLHRLIEELRHSEDTESLISTLLIAHHIDEMGEAMLSISEAILSAILGQRVSTRQYQNLKTSLSELPLDDKGHYDVETLAETRSGSAIAGIADRKRPEQGYLAVLKAGARRKLKEEREGVEQWHRVYPGLAPKIIGHHRQGKSAALLIEHLAGMTFERILLHESRQLLATALEALTDTLESVWTETRTDQEHPAGFMQQLRKRQQSMYAIHPEFRQSEVSICGHHLAAFEALVEQALEFEQALKQPSSVYIHGDFNLDNIIYDPVQQRINFIDLHRSRYMDYVQDVSVFLVSNYRLQILDKSTRRRILQVCRDFHQFTSDYADRVADRSFEQRLALGLARSFATSTRFILDKSLARAMFLRARYLLQSVLNSDPAQPARYRIPIKEIFSD